MKKCQRWLFKTYNVPASQHVRRRSSAWEAAAAASRTAHGCLAGGAVDKGRHILLSGYRVPHVNILQMDGGVGGGAEKKVGPVGGDAALHTAMLCPPTLPVVPRSQPTCRPPAQRTAAAEHPLPPPTCWRSLRNMTCGRSARTLYSACSWSYRSCSTISWRDKRGARGGVLAGQ